MASHIRRARKYGNGTVDDIDLLKVFERDGGRCGICGNKVNRSLRWPQPMSATLDHIAPLSRGGTHIWQNVQLAHLVCNLHKSNKGGGQTNLGFTIDNKLSVPYDNYT